MIITAKSDIVRLLKDGEETGWSFDKSGVVRARFVCVYSLIPRDWYPYDGQDPQLTPTFKKQCESDFIKRMKFDDLTTSSFSMRFETKRNALQEPISSKVTVTAAVWGEDLQRIISGKFRHGFLVHHTSNPFPSTFRDGAKWILGKNPRDTAGNRSPSPLTSQIKHLINKWSVTNSFRLGDPFESHGGYSLFDSVYINSEDDDIWHRKYSNYRFGFVVRVTEVWVYILVGDLFADERKIYGKKVIVRKHHADVLDGENINWKPKIKGRSWNIHRRAGMRLYSNF